MKRTETVTVIGAGKMGLPIACQIASRGAKVIACDINPDIVKSVNAGICPFDEPGVPDLLSRSVKSGSLEATTDTTAAVSRSTAVIVIVPVLLNSANEADTAIIRAVSADIAAGLKPGTLVSYETTLPVGGTRSLVPVLEQSGLSAGNDFDLTFSPERVKSQKVLERLSQTPKIVGGITQQSTNRGAAFYEEFLGAPAIKMDSLESAELVKLAGMVYRDINIAVANELARYADSIGANIHQVIAAANTNGEAGLLSPGIGVGGHCTPVYPYFMTGDARRKGAPLSLAEKSRLINDGQPAYFLDLLEKNWQSLNGKRAAILGLGFRPEVKESICSPAFLIREELMGRGASVALHDPLFSSKEIEEHGFTCQDLNAKSLPEVLILNTAHKAYADVNFADLAKRGVKAIVDGRCFWDSGKIEKTGIRYISSGCGSRTVDKTPPAIPVAKPWIDSAESNAAAAVVSSGWLLQGPQVQALESEFASYTGARHAVAVSSGTAALHLALIAAGVGAGDEVITVSHSFIATANSIRYCGAKPVFVDIEPDTFNINPELVEESISDKTRAILCVHQMGMPCELAALRQIASEHNLPLIEDAACAAGSQILMNGNWQLIGKPHGDMVCFSFHPRKILTTGDGGMITTDSAEMAEKMRLLRNHSIDRSSAGETYDMLGYNYRLTDIQAAVGRKQLERLPAMVAQRRELAARYAELLSPLPGVVLPAEPEWARSNWQSYCIRLAGEHDRDAIIQALDKMGISTRPGIMCAHRENAYKLEPWSSRSGLKESESAQDNGLILPLFHDMSAEEQDRVVDALSKALRTGYSGQPKSIATSRT